MKPLILGSSSPRRADYLILLGVHFHQVLVSYNESIHVSCADQAAHALVLSKMAQLRAALCCDQKLWPSNCTAPHELGRLLVADTLVACQGQILGKPADANEAEQMLQALSGQVHQVITGVAIGDLLEEEVVIVTTDVHFRNLSSPEIRAYVATGEPMDKAGSYGLQGLGGSFVTKVNGSVSGVVGLPLAQTQALLTRWGQAHRLSEAL